MRASLAKLALVPRSASSRAGDRTCTANASIRSCRLPISFLNLTLDTCSLFTSLRIRFSTSMKPASWYSRLCCQKATGLKTAAPTAHASPRPEGGDRERDATADASTAAQTPPMTSE
jgi:hypothetical protein